MKSMRIGLLMAACILLLVPQGTARSDTLTAYDLIAAVNALRQRQGLAALETNGALMAAAQGQSNHLAATYGTDPPSWDMGHVGAGGTTVRDRAVAAGYPLPAGWNVLENWAAARSGTAVATIVNSMWSGAIHWNQMINPDAKHVGVGVSESGGMVYYILKIGVQYGSSGATGAGVAATIPTAAATARVSPVQLSTPQSDGAIIHMVRIRQTLWAIALAYDVTVDQLIALNGLPPNPVIYEGQELIIQAGHTPTPSPTVTLTPRPPTRTPIPQQTAVQLAPEVEDAPPFSILEMDRRSMGIALILVCGVGLVMIVLGTASKGRARKKKGSDDTPELPPDDLF